MLVTGTAVSSAFLLALISSFLVILSAKVHDQQEVPQEHSETIHTKTGVEPSQNVN